MQNLGYFYRIHWAKSWTYGQNRGQKNENIEFSLLTSAPNALNCEENSRMSYPAKVLGFSSDLTWIESLFDDKVREGQYIDFKAKHYDFSIDNSKKELAKDVSAFANSQGGFLVIGIKSDSQGIPVEKTTVELSEEIPKKYKRTLDKLIQPNLAYRFHDVALDSDPSEGYFVIEIQVTRSRPHAYLDGNSLAFSIRHGSEGAPMSEPELKSQFESRFTSEFFQLQRIESLEADAINGIDLSQNWLILTSTPDLLSDVEISTAMLEILRSKLLGDYGIEYSTHYQYNGLHVGFKKFIATGMGGVSEPNRYLFGNFHHDGSTVLGVQLPSAITYAQLDERELQIMPEIVFEQEAIVKAALVMLKVSLEYSKFANLSGQVNYQLNLELNSGQSYGVAPYSRSGLIPPITGKSKFRHNPGRVSDLLDALFARPTTRNALVRNLCNQLFQNFGIAECVHIKSNGQLEPTRWQPGELNTISELVKQEAKIESEIKYPL